MGISSFYTGFVVAPFASNAAELLSAYVYAAKKSKLTMTTALSTLLGAACMNNTFVLAILFGLIYVQKLAWEFTSETISIMLIQWVIGAIAIKKKTHTLLLGCIIMSCYPACLLLNVILEAQG